MSTLLAFLLALIIVVAVHEWGHFYTARRLGILVSRFSIGMGPAIWSKNHAGVDYQLAILPLGGYVQFTDAQNYTVTETEQAQLFERQPLWKKAAVVFAGPLVNFILAYVLMVIVLMVGIQSPKAWVAPGQVGTPWAEVSGDDVWRIDQINHVAVEQFEQLPIQLLRQLSHASQLTFELSDFQGTTKQVTVDASPWRELAWSNPKEQFERWGLVLSLPNFPAVVEQVETDSAAARAGLLTHDRIIAIDGMKVDSFADLSQWVRLHPHKQVSLTLLRADALLEVPLTIGARELNDEVVVGYLGVRPSVPDNLSAAWLSTAGLPFIDAAQQAPQKLLDLTLLTLQAVGRLVSGQSGLEQLSGPIGIAQAAGNSLDQGWIRFFQFLALLSLSLGVLNLLPLPVLDGGHLLLYAAEAIRGKAFSDEFMLLWQKIGLVMIVGLTVLAISSDINRLFGG